MKSSTQNPGTPVGDVQETPSDATATRPPATLPEWLLPRPDLDGLLDAARSGKTLTAFCRGQGCDPGKLRGWIHSDPHRLVLYRDAQAIGVEKLADELLDIADGSYSGLQQDVQRDTLRVKTRQYLLEIHDRDRYGSKAKVEVGVTVDLTGVMQEARQRVERSTGRTFEGEVVNDGRT